MDPTERDQAFRGHSFGGVRVGAMPFMSSLIIPFVTLKGTLYVPLFVTIEVPLNLSINVINVIMLFIMFPFHMNSY